MGQLIKFRSWKACLIFENDSRSGALARPSGRAQFNETLKAPMFAIIAAFFTISQNLVQLATPESLRSVHLRVKRDRGWHFARTLG